MALTGGWLRAAAPAPARDPWSRIIPASPERESYNCALSLGLGGELSGKGFLGTRILGRTQEWR